MNNFDKIYKNVPLEQRKELLQFREGNSLRTIVVKDTKWEYLISGEHENTLLILTGFLGRAENGFKLIQRLSVNYKVISVNYPPVKKLNQLIYGIIAILDFEKINHISLFGGSYGGIIAQHLVRQYPDRVTNLILSATTAPNAKLGRKLNVVIKIIRYMPIRLIRRLIKSKFRTQLKGSHFNIAYFSEMLISLTKEDILSRYIVMKDSSVNSNFSDEDLKHWHGRVMIFFGTHDSMIKPEQQNALASIYPQANIHKFSNAGHLLDPVEQSRIIKEFLD